MKLLQALLASLLLLVIGATPVRADLVAGRDYAVLNPARPVSSGDKIEVIEFFWYGCPHCNDLHPHLKKWVKQLPKDVEIRYQPTIFRDNWVPGARIHYTLEALGEAERRADEVYDAIHLERLDLGNEKVLFDWVAKRGMDRQKFIDAYNSFAVQGKVAKARQMPRDYQIRGVPAIVVDGKYLTSGSFTGSSEGMVAVLDELVKKARSERAGKKR